MRLPRIYVDLHLQSGKQVVLPARASQHLVQVLRLRPDDRLTLFNGDGREFSAKLVTASKSNAIVSVGDAGEPEPPQVLAAHLGIGISKGERMDYALQKAVELGAGRITPLFTKRSVVRLSGERLDKRLAHWRGVIQAACEQSGRRRLPPLAPATDLDSWLKQPHPAPLLLDHRSSLTLPELPAPGGAITLLVGPEGGLEPRERENARAAGFRGVRLGPYILRTETAPLAALAAIQVLWGDFRDKPSTGS